MEVHCCCDGMVNMMVDGDMRPLSKWFNFHGEHS
jgi:hypothetical protein